jgi:hypothetical protein
MPARRTLALLLVCLIPLVASCGGEKKDDSAGGTTTSASAPQTITGDTSATTQTTQPQMSFAEGVSTINKAIDVAHGDMCKLVALSASVNVANPTTPDQVRTYVDTAGRYFDAIADASPTGGAALHQAADDFRAEAAASNYDVEKITKSKSIETIASALTKASQKCRPAP